MDIIQIVGGVLFVIALLLIIVFGLYLLSGLFGPRLEDLTEGFEEPYEYEFLFQESINANS